jgi:DNA-binding Lrp family transcriptional regulator
MEDWITIRNLKNRNPRMGTRKIAKKLGLSRNTVKNALKSEDAPEYKRGTYINPELETFHDFIIQKIKRISGTPPDWKRREEATNKYKLSGGVVIVAIFMTRSRFLFKTLKCLCHEILLLSFSRRKTNATNLY